MSVGSGELSRASDPETTPPYSAAEVALSDWPSDVKRAWNTIRSVNKGDTVLWGDRSQSLEVRSITENDDGTHDLRVEGPRGGDYTIRERYDDAGNPTIYADDSSAMDLHSPENDDEDLRPFTEEMYEAVVNNLIRASVNAYVENEYENYNGAVGDVVQSWVEDVEFQRWSGWPYEWEADDPDYIFRMVREHSGQLPETPEGEQTSPKNQARRILDSTVTTRGKEMAHTQLIRDEEDYRATVLKLADDAVDRDDLKAHMDARQATRSVVEDFIDAHTDPIHRSIIKYSDEEPMDFEFYEGLDEEDITREMALDVLDEDVWSRAREVHAERGTHDPTVRGIAFFEYDQLVEELVEKALRENQIDDNRLLYTTANEVVRDFTTEVENHNWPYDFGGVDDRTWGAGDAEDIFTSIVMHAEVDPHIFNPFARDKEQKMAAQVLTEVVHDRASNALDEEELNNAKPVPANEYLSENFDGDLDFNDIRDDTDVKPEDFIRTAIEGMEPEEMENLAGWTFVDELVEEAGASVPYMAGPWVLVDYGLVHKNNKHRRIAYFNRDTGAVLTLSGLTTQPAEQGEFGYGNFHVNLVTWGGDDEPNYLVSDANLDYAFSFVRDYVGANNADVNIIETADGDHYIQEAVTEDDINTTPFAAGIAPDFKMPGPGFSVDDVVAKGSTTFQKVGKWLTDNSRIVDAAATTAVALALAEASYLAYRVAPGLNIQPDYDKKYGVGVTASYEFGQDSSQIEKYHPEDDDSKPYSGRINSNVRITPGAMKFLTDAATPEWLYTAGPDATVLTTMKARIEDPIQRNTDDFFRNQRRSFLGAHVPPEPKGMPKTANDYVNPLEVKAGGHTYYPQYALDKGDVPDDYVENDGSGPYYSETRTRELLKRLALHGYAFERTGGSNYYWGGDSDLRTRVGVEHDPNESLDPALLQELGWSLKRSYLFGPTEQRAVGDPGEVEEHWDDGIDIGPVCTNAAFLKVWSDLPDTPNTTVVNQAWKFYRDRANDTDEFTLLDAYDRFRMSLVYEAAEQSTQNVMSVTLREAAEDDSGYTLRGAFKRPIEREYWWNLTSDLAASEVFDSDGISQIGPWLIFRADDTPPAHVDYYFYDDADGYMHHVPGRGDEPYNDGAQNADDNVTTYRLATYQDLFNVLTHDITSEVTNAVQGDGTKFVKEPSDYEEGDPIPNEERKWVESDENERMAKVASGNVDWDDLDGTDLSVMGLFLRGIDVQTAAQMTDHWNLSDRFQTRLSDVMPSGWNPSRPDRPSFEEWLDKRRGKNAIGSAAEKAKAKARYLREVAGTAPDGVETRDALGFSRASKDESERRRDVAEHYGETDYENFEQFYGEEFGNAFDDVAHKFNEQEPYDRPDGEMDDIDMADTPVPDQMETEESDD